MFKTGLNFKEDAGFDDVPILAAGLLNLKACEGLINDITEGEPNESDEQFPKRS